MNTSATSPQKKLVILHLFPHTLNLNGDTGNVDILHFRARERNFLVERKFYESSEALPNNVDLIFIGNGSVSAQTFAHKKLESISAPLKELADSGVPFLAVGAGFQLMGESIAFPDKTTLAGAGIFPVNTRIGSVRVVGDCVVDSRLGTLVGFENKAALLDIKGATSIGSVRYGQGNSPECAEEGFWVQNLIGTHLQGPVLANNPVLADWLLAASLQRKGDDLPPGSDRLQQIDLWAAHVRRGITAHPLSE